jgi:hypothetical protein
MKKRLLKPPSNDGEIFFLPDLRKFLPSLKEESRVGTAHQPYFFNPGVSLKFLALEYLPKGYKKFLFLDTDKVRINIKIPYKGGIKVVNLINSEEVLAEYSVSGEKIFRDFFSIVEEELRKTFSHNYSDVFENFFHFQDIIFRNLNRKFLKEILAESFLQFYGIKTNYEFLSRLIEDKEFRDFFLHICKDDERFRHIFNQSLDDYKENFRFRFINFPFPKLKDGELPFWIVKEARRLRCFKKDLRQINFKKLKIFPRAYTLTIFLRLYKLDCFIHGIGGANYEWVGNRIIERFFKKKPPLYVVMSGTFLLKGIRERQLPYFFFNPQKIRERTESFINSAIAELIETVA